MLLPENVGKQFMTHISASSQELECTYREVQQISDLGKLLESHISMFNDTNNNCRITISIFNLAIEMVVKINRAIQ